MIVQICIGSSCHIKGSAKIVEKMKNAIELYGLENEITLAGSFCTGNCNRSGVTLLVDDETVTGVTPETFTEFFKTHVYSKLEGKCRP